jgi:hypothetical protein
LQTSAQIKTFRLHFGGLIRETAYLSSAVLVPQLIVREAPILSCYRLKHTLPDLSYDYNALEPVISAEIMQVSETFNYYVRYPFLSPLNYFHFWRNFFVILIFLLFLHTKPTFPMIDRRKSIMPLSFFSLSIFPVFFNISAGFGIILMNQFTSMIGEFY